jgi:imidazole glycerol-phosphate synthase subunit HisH
MGRVGAVRRLAAVIGVIDYRAGNAPSVGFALEHLGLEHRLVDSPDGLRAADRLVLPGVGAARATLASLYEADLVDVLSERVIDGGVPFLGICIGLQVLFEHSDEGDIDGLGWVPGVVRRFSGSERVPQIGWNTVTTTRAHPVTEGLPDPAYCYFVNSYYCEPADPDVVLGVTEYATPFCSVAARDNIVATQFHAEKSGPVGLGLLERFARWEHGC